MAEVASAYVSLLPSARGFGKKLDSQVGGEVDASGKKSGTRWGNAMKAGAAAGLAALGVAAVKILGDSVGAASEAQQAVGGVQAVFGKYADGVLADSKRAADGLGLSAAAYNELVTVSGAMLKNKGLKDFADQSKSLITVGADLSAMFGGTTKDAVDALNAALRGESDPIEKYGIALNAASIEAEAVSSGLVKNVKNFGKIKAAQNTALLAQRKYNDALKEHGKGSDEALASESSLIRAKAALSKALEGEKIELTSTQKAQAALSLVQKQSADATGAFARESDTLAGQQQRLGAEWDNLKVTLGTALLPGLTDAASVARKVFKNFDTIGPVLAAVAGGMLAYKVASLAAGAAAAIQAAGTTAATGATWSLNAALRANPIGLVITAITLLAAGMVLAYKKSDTFRNIVDKAFAAVKKAGSAMGDTLGVAFDAIGVAIDAVGKAGTWLWNKALQPAFKFIVNGVAGLMDIWADMLGVLGKVPGFGWAKEASKAMAEAASTARDVADGIKKIPTHTTVTITTSYITRNRGKERSMGGDYLPRAAGLPGRNDADRLMSDYGDMTMQAFSRGIEKGSKKTRAQLTKVLDGLKGKLSTLKDDFAALAESVSSALVGDLFGVTATAADAEAGIAGSTVGQNFIAGLTAKKGELTSLLASFKTLAGWGIAPSFLSQLFASGNGALITELAGMGKAGAVGAANLFGEVSSLGTQLGNAVATKDYGPNIDKMAAEISELRKDIAKLPRAVKDGAKEGTREGSDDRNKDTRQRERAGR